MKTAALLLAAAVSASAWAGEAPSSRVHAGHSATTSAPASATKGIIRKVDKEAGKLTISHGPLLNLDMPAMTMVFNVTDKAFLDVQPGQKISFSAESVEGRLTVVNLQSEH